MTEVLEYPRPLVKGRLPRGPSQRYRALCERVGYKPVELIEQDFVKWLFNEEIPLYADEQVEKYLEWKAEQKQRANSLAGNVFTRYSVFWRPLRETDIETDLDTDRADNLVYDKMVPERVLLTVEKVLGRYPKAKFYVSDIQEVLDPFLKVDLGCLRDFIVAAWDEPGFSG
jgi:hypothetical protein